MTEPDALQQRRLRLMEQIGQAADEIKRIDSRLNDLLAGNRGHGGAGAA